MISVIIPTYNRYDLLIKAIDSVLNQTFKELELIVVDDCSTDERYNTLYQDERIKYIKTPERSHNPAVVRNIGIKSSIYDWVAFLDDDDFWFEQKLEEQLKYVNFYDFICCDASSHGINWTTVLNKQFWISANPTEEKELDYEMISKHNLIINSSVLIKKKLMESINYYPEDKIYHRKEDYVAWLEILSKNIKCFFVDKPLLYYNTSSIKNH